MLNHRSGAWVATKMVCLTVIVFVVCHWLSKQIQLQLIPDFLMFGTMAHTHPHTQRLEFFHNLGNIHQFNVLEENNRTFGFIGFNHGSSTLQLFCFKTSKKAQYNVSLNYNVYSYNSQSLYMTKDHIFLHSCYSYHHILLEILTNVLP